MSSPEFAKSIIAVVRAEDQIGGKCPRCAETFRLSEVELFYIPDRKEDFLTELRKKQRDLDQNLEKMLTLAREDAIKRSRSSIMGKLFETVRPYLPGFRYNPNDLRAIWNPVDFVCFNGLALNRSVESITFIDIKTGRSTLNPAQRSIREAVRSNKVTFETIPTESADDLDLGPGPGPVGTG